jgi:hypothetical protein
MRRFQRIIKKSIGKFQYLLNAGVFQGVDVGSLYYICNICGQKCVSSFRNISREVPSCLGCNSSVRMRSVMYAISLALLGKGVILPEFPFMPHVRAIGLSDWDGYALPLANKINYKNTYYHQEPKLDIMSIDPLLSNTVDILISSDVFEHVAPPVQVAFRNSYELLCSGGKLILTVPYTLSDDTIEHFPNMYKHQIRNDNGKYVVDNITRDGKVEIYEDLTFHGGDGNTLEMRIFSLSILLGMLSDVGFKDIMILQEPVFEYGIYFKDHLSLPVLATKP